MAEMSKPKCTVCGKPVEDIGPLDVPYHIERVVRQIQKYNHVGNNGHSRRRARNRKAQ